MVLKQSFWLQTLLLLGVTLGNGLFLAIANAEVIPDAQARSILLDVAAAPRLSVQRLRYGPAAANGAATSSMRMQLDWQNRTLKEVLGTDVLGVASGADEAMALLEKTLPSFVRRARFEELEPIVGRVTTRLILDLTEGTRLPVMERDAKGVYRLLFAPEPLVTTASTATAASSVGLEALKRQIDLLQAQLNEQEQRYEARLASVQKIRYEAEGRVAQAEQQLNQAKTQLKQLKQQSQASQHSLDRLTDAQVALKTQLAELSENRRALEVESAQLKRDKTALQAEANSIATLKADLQRAQEKLQQAASTITRQTREMTQLRQQVARVEGGLNSNALEQLTALNQKLEEKEAELKKLQSNAVSGVASATLGYSTNLGKDLLTEGNPEEAKTVVLKAMANQMPKQAFQVLSGAYRKLGDEVSAELVLQTALLFSPNDAELRFSLANVYHGQKQYAQARRHYEAALVARPDFAEAQYNLGLVLAKLGQKTEAIGCLTQYLQLLPADKSEKNKARAVQVTQYIEQLKQDPLKSESLKQEKDIQ